MESFYGRIFEEFSPKNITDIWLKQIKEVVLDSDFLWQEVLSLHDALSKSPLQLKETSPSDYQLEHSIFWALIREEIQRQVAQLTG